MAAPDLMALYQQHLRQQQMANFWGGINRLGAGIAAAGQPGGGMSGISQGLMGMQQQPPMGQPGDMLTLLRLQEAQAARERETAQREQWQNLMTQMGPGGAMAGAPGAGADIVPAPTGNMPGAAPPLTREQLALLRLMGPQAGGQAMAKWLTPTAPRAPTTAGGFYKPQGQPWAPIPGYQEAALERAAASRAEGPTINVGPTGIDYGKPPPDYGWARNPDGSVMLQPTQTESGETVQMPLAVPLPGGPAAREIAAGEEAEAVKEAQKEIYTDIVTQDIDRAIALTEDATVPVTGFGSFLAAVPGTTARDVTGLVDTIRANVGFDRLQQMRDSSPTGGALGQVSEMENRLMQATLGNLEQSQSQEQFLYNLKRIRNIYTDIVPPPIEQMEPRHIERLLFDSARELTPDEVAKVEKRMNELGM